MADRVDGETRSRIMSAIRSRNTGPERRLHGILCALHVRHRMHPRGIPGSPDCLAWGADGRATLIFVDGCFWHAHGHVTVPRSDFWRAKLARNAERDARTTRSLRRSGWRVRRIWECEMDKAAVRRAAGLR